VQLLATVFTISARERFQLGSRHLDNGTLGDFAHIASRIALDADLIAIAQPLLVRLRT
jgi:hypothetical protein